MSLPRLVVLIALSVLVGCEPEPAKDVKDNLDSGENVSPDGDGDGHGLDDDCDDADASVYVGAPELCDGIDNDCDGTADEDTDDGNEYFVDGDGDGYGDGQPVRGCEQPEGTATRDGDCDDADALVSPDADEVCDGVDNDCDGSTDEDTDDGVAYYLDRDADGHGSGAAIASCGQPDDTVTVGDDCDDTDGAIHPDATEVCNGIDDNCDGYEDEGLDDGIDWYVDDDGDGYGAGSAYVGCEVPANAVEEDGDCDDTVAATHPGATETCNEIDDDCDGSVDEAAVDMSTWYPDTDRDTYGDDSSAGTVSCVAPAGFVSSRTDCDDATSTVSPAATETCNDIDDDCDGSVDESGATGAYTLYPDADSDGYGSSSASSVSSCDPLSGYTTNRTDCNDSASAINPGAIEVCDSVDNDCDSLVDGTDAVDSFTVWPDTDGDGFGAGRSSVTCSSASGFVTNDDDCDDADEDVNPDADESCNAEDDDCDGTVDEDAVDATYLYADDDGDTFGDAADYDLRCDGVDNALDCDDADATEPQVVDASSTATRPDGTASMPWQTIQDGIDAADECVLVLEGTYIENIDFGGDDLLVMSETGADDTIIDGSGGGPVVTFDDGEGAGAELRGFTLVHGSGFEEETTSTRSCGSSTTCTDHYITYCGGGIYVDGSTPTLSDLMVSENVVTTPADSSSGNDYYYYYGFGGGLCVRNAVLEVENVNLWDNYADDGGGAYVESTGDLTYTHGTVYGNTAVSGAGFEVDGGDLELSNSVLAWNVASESGGAVYAVDATVSVVNVTVGECEATDGGGLYASGTSVLTVLNSIIYGSDAGVGILGDSTATFSGTYNDVYGNTDGNYDGVTNPTGSNGNLSVDPSFRSVSDDGNFRNDDWKLNTSSSCVNAGRNTSAYNDADGTRNDIGAYGGPGGSW